MTPLKDNVDVASFLVTKHSWKGKYKRVLAIGTHGITTYNPDRLEVTNKWPYSDIITVASTRHSNSPTSAAQDFTLVLRKDRKTDTMRFSSEHKALVLTEAFKYRHLFAEKPKDSCRYEGYKHHWSDMKLPVVLEVTPCSLDQLDPATYTVLASYHYCDIQGIIGVSDYPGGLVVACGGFSRLHLFSSPQHQEIRTELVRRAGLLNLSIKVLGAAITLDDFHEQRFGKYSGDLQQTSISEFVVHKVSPARHMEPVRRTLCVSDSCLLERDPQTYSLVCLRPLVDVFALVRDPAHPQAFSIEYQSGQTRSYLAAERDALLASLLDGVRAAGNRDVHVRSSPTPRGKRFGPLHLPVDEETEANHLRLFQNPGNLSRAEVIERFNANVGYSGLLYSVNQDRLFSENKEKLIVSALQGLTCGSAPAGARDLAPLELEGQFHALRRLTASKVGFAAFTTLPGFREWVGTAVVAALRRGEAACSHAALDAVCALLQPMHADPDLRQEQLNKASMLSAAPFLEGLLNMWSERVNQGSDALVVAAMLDFLTFALCVPYSETTDGKQFDQLLEMVAARGRVLFKLFEHPSMAIVKGAGLVMRALIEEGTAEVGQRMQALALAEAALPRHLLAALYSQPRLQHRQLSRHLVGLWTADHPPAGHLLKRIMPSGLLAFLESTEAVPAAALEADRLLERDNMQLAQELDRKSRRGPQWAAIERQIKYVEKHLEHYTALALQHWAQQTGMAVERRDSLRERPVVLRRRRERLKAHANWPYFYYQFHRDHAVSNLIWNHTTREELRSALEGELRAFESDRELATGGAGGGGTLVAWNHRELELHYQCLQNEVKIGDYYLRLLLEQRDNEDSPIRRSYEFFNDLYHRFLSTPKVEMKCMCLQAMSIVYGRYHEDIGPFADTKYIVQMLDRTCDKMERDRLVQFLSKLILHRGNVSELLEWNGIRILVELMTLAHLHTSRATAPAQSNVIEAGATQPGGDKEWYYNLEDGGAVKRIGPVTFQEMKDLYASGKINGRTKCWANSMEGWRALQAVPQLKWTLVARGEPVLNESELAATILDLLIQCAQYYPSRDEDNAVIRPLPRVKRLLSEPLCLAHIVQILLTFDPRLVEKVATLLTETMQDNPDVSKLYMTGAFYFLLLYTGSNVLPIARLLQLTHMVQAFRADDAGSSDIMQRSILGQLLPEAMVCYLHNHGADKFAQIFLGEYDTPEAIWNSEMRRMLMMKISAHIGEFTPRLRAHVAARYPYLAIPAVRYPQLQNELFCHMFYLRHLCDTLSFPDWPIPDPVRLLKETLEAWRREVERKPPAMTVEEAYLTLGLPGGTRHDEAAVRKAYYRLAQQFHPDKNPAGRERFDSVSQAYEFLCSRSVWSADGPDTNNIVLLLRTQTILFQRHSEELSPYKYAGYPQLLSTVRLETEAEQLFVGQAPNAGNTATPLLPAACELAHATVTCSALNAEELRREGGLEVLHSAMTRCVSVLSRSSRASDLAVSVCVHCCRCFAVAAQFPQCRAVMAATEQLIADVVRILHFIHLGAACCAAAEAAGALAATARARSALARAGALHALLAAALLYDYTLAESGLDTDTDKNKQEVANRLAKISLSACARLAGVTSLEDSGPADQHIQVALQRLLTPYLCAKMADTDPAELLKMLTSNWRTPYLVWDNSTRAELSDLLETHRPSPPHAQEEGEGDDVAPPILVPADFRYSAHEGLLVVGGVYLAIYNEQPTFPIEKPAGLVIDLLSFVSSRSLAESPLSTESVQDIVMALTALANVISKNPGVEIQCIGQFGLLFGLLSARGHPTLQLAALRVLETVTGHRECVEDMAASCVQGHLLGLLPYLHDRHLATLLAVLAALLVNTKIVKEVLVKGGVVYLLDLFCNGSTPEAREAAADLLARMMADKLHGPKVRLSVLRYLPPVFADAMRDGAVGGGAGSGGGGGGGGGAAAAVHMFDTNHEHPELVWDDTARAAAARTVAALKDQHHSAQLRSPNAALVEGSGGAEGGGESAGATWAPPGEVVVGGVYLRLFLQNPQWAVRSPKHFLRELLQETLTSLARDSGQSSRSELCARALAALVRTRPALGEAAAQLGEMPRLARLLPRSPALAVPVLAALAQSQTCVSALAQTECVSGLAAAMRASRECVGAACEALAALFSTSSHADTDRLVLQALESELIAQLLQLLESRLEVSAGAGAGAGAGHSKAQIVAALKAMCRSSAHGERVRAALERSAIWEQYAAQRHDLFISSAPQHNYLTGVPQAAGYLTAAPASIPVQPPPPPVD